MSRTRSTLAGCTLALALVVAAPSAWAGKQDAIDAEHVRLSEEMSSLAKRNAWRGVNDAYLELLKLEKKGLVPSYKDHYLGAQAARSLGDINATYRRVQRASDVDNTAEVQAWLADITANYGYVELAGKADACELLVDEMPMAPDQRTAIEVAMRKVTSECEYSGLLPIGGYSINGQALAVAAGGEASVAAVASADKPDQPAKPEKPVKPDKPAKPEKPESEGGGLVYVGLRADLGPSFSKATDTTQAGAQPGDFGGPGARVGVGVELGLSAKLGLVLQVGYHGMFGSPADATGKLEAVPQYDLDGDKMNMGFGWAAASLRLNPDLSVAAGPSLAYGKGQVTGWSSTCIDAVCSDLAGSQEALRYQRLEGTIMAAGGTLGATYALADMGSMRAGLSVLGGASNDGARWYPWGQLALTLSPALPVEE